MRAMTDVPLQGLHCHEVFILVNTHHELECTPNPTKYHWGEIGAQLVEKGEGGIRTYPKDDFYFSKKKIVR